MFQCDFRGKLKRHRGRTTVVLCWQCRQGMLVTLAEVIVHSTGINALSIELLIHLGLISTCEDDSSSN